MASLSAPRDTAEYVDNTFVTATVASDTTIYAGALVAINTSGKAIPAADATGIRSVVGRAEFTATAGQAIKIKRGVFGWNNDTTNAVEATDIGKTAYVVDDHTVSDTAGSYSVVAGVIKGLNADGTVRVAPLPLGAVAPGPAVADLTAAGDLTYTKINAILASLRAAGVLS